ncbi:hypothetical protein FHS95_000439 [Sphingomonas naasensis]|uniref:Uncharacterized protein n=1 Tax=Sphingomonas naasensis TaxID=1344951 RepID=A0A4S1WSI2_9SPHN|nr:hypothetical protein [Sphingomonas naasensis]NIJ18770.1 hypothetical protein [Sphingomonas naasensis]TGX46003.1 hypothetical protein E5A74_02175 [Sphingomonas naasensis]
MLPILLLLSAPATPLELACRGGGIATREDVATVYGAQNSGNSAWPSAHARETGRFEGPVALRIAAGESHIRLPAAMLPADAQGGWLALGKLEMDDGAITGFAAIDPMSRPKVHIDRATGTIRISGRLASYSGTCETTRS